ncbi:MAG: hypothetical protein PHQ75_06525, partial [Thermoguttaceae bacterium]|nr:hypothetical protein [Thermoguttaceae bacterium]
MLQQWHKRYTVILVASLFMFASGLVFAAKETPTVPQKENIIKNSQADKAKTDDKAKVKSDDKAKVKSDDKPKVKTADKAKVKSDDKAKVKSDDKAKAKTDDKANVKTADKAKVKSDDKAKAKTADKAKVKSDDKAKVKSDDKAKAKTDDKANVKTVAKKTSPGSPEEKEPSMTRLLRYPHIHGNDVVFVYGGDLWKAPISGGLAARLTASEGLELFPRFSPDGKWIAFTGQYDGDEQVYVIPSEGGIPKQLTWYPIAGPVPPRRGVEHQVLGWTPDSKKVLFRSGRDSNSVDILTNLYTVDLEGGLPEKLPMPVAGAGTISPDGTKVVYSPLYRDFRHWKRYEGGWAQYLLIYDLEKKTYKRIPTTPRTDRDPMWIGSDVYFLSDREGTMKLYRYDADSNKVEKKLGHDAWDMRWATSDNEKRIVYELGGKLFLYDTASKVRREIQIRVPHDGLAMRPSRINVGQWLEEFELSPQGKRALFVARGDVFTVPAEKGLVRNLTNSSNAHDRGAVWSPQGRWIAFISDMEGEDQIYLIDQSGTGKPLRITSTFKNKLDDLRWSPCGTSLSVWDAKDHLYVIDLDLTKADRPKAKNVTTIARELYEGPRHTAWSPSGEYLALVLNVQTGGSVIYIWSRQTGKLIQVTDPIFDSFSPAFAPNGDWLYYIAQREFYPQISTSMEWNFACNRFCGLFAVPLRKDVENIFLAKSDEVEIKDNKAGESKDAKDAKDGTSAKDESKSKSHAKTAKKDDVKKDDAKKDDVKKDDAKTARKAKTGKSDDKSD